LVPGNPDLIRNQALALAAEGETEVAVTMLSEALGAQPGWIDGHRILASLRITSGDGEQADLSYAQACRREGSEAPLWMAWFQHHAVARRWDRAGQILSDAKREVGPSRNLDLASIFLASESGAAADDDHLFDAFASAHDPGLDLCAVRHFLRSRQVDRAEAVAGHHVGGASARMFWPYLSLCWRMRGDARAQWLDGEPELVQTLDLDLTERELSELAAVLRDLHRMKAPYPEQSVRGGTQTDRQLFFHPSPIVQTAKAKISAGIAEFVRNLPSGGDDHPLLMQRRDQILFEGSWSVRLPGTGFHACHTHVKGWISSAFYVALPETGARGTEPAGWLALGTPPPELGLALAPTRLIEPKAARLVLFPSTTWHSTVAYDAGERLTMAFDVRIPGP
jgi:hypothetical protein